MLFIMGLAASLMVILLDLMVDYFIYGDKELITVVMINLRPSSLWTDLLILVSYLGFSYVLFRLQRDSAKEQKIVDEEATHAGPGHPVPKPNQYGHDERHASRHQQNKVESNIHPLGLRGRVRFLRLP